MFCCADELIGKSEIDDVLPKSKGKSDPVIYEIIHSK